MQEGMCQLISRTVDSSSALLEDGLDLWLSLIENSPQPLSVHLFKLFAFMPNLLSTHKLSQHMIVKIFSNCLAIQSEHLKLCLEIVNGYGLFQSESFVAVSSIQIFS